MRYRPAASATAWREPPVSASRACTSDPGAAVPSAKATRPEIDADVVWASPYVASRLAAANETMKDALKRYWP